MGEKGKVCVTGAGGYVASWLVKFLLSKEYIVHGTVREPADEKNAHLMKLDKAADKLQLFKASLQDYGSLLAAIKGCSGVFHVACPVPSGPTELVEPAVVGTQNVLRACSEAGIKRLVVVSSVAAAMNPNWPKNRPMDENCWTDIDYCMTIQNSFNWYSIAKTVSESEALKYSEKSEFDVITLCPSFILGPLLQPTMNASNILFNELFKGPEAIENRARVIVDVRDVAEALLLVYEKPEASGRYICAPHPIRIRDMVAMLKTKYPNYNYPKRYIEVDEDDLKFSSEKLKRLGWNYKPLEDTLVDTIDQYQEAGAGRYVGSWLVKFLLSKEYIVHGTVREPADVKNAHLMKLDKAADKLLLFKASLQDYDSLLAAIKGCSGVFHVAYPVPTGTLTADEKNAHLKKLEKAAENLLLFKADLLDYDSLCSAIEGCGGVFHVVPFGWYSLAKTMAESEAFEYAKRSGLEVVTICPSWVFRPLILQPSINAASLLFVMLLKGLGQLYFCKFVNLCNAPHVAV
ncbi:Cinnamoyl-CoA reductase 2 [Cinnamomum micranthum f. kanehirae]|uniref:Cinnamoyl-CoA reductase 2 n=1 Tax=Cinnamomum micranthum f. kanehirae TaxID=337451 RepID=A0A3S3N6V4_9MAGN|nr:Cinnamoyl-CoA reductase 2 [Cinnamomum micranthum f. kanehirae]